MRSLRSCLPLVMICLAQAAWSSGRAQTVAGPSPGRIVTVLGPLDPTRLGRTLMHEHVLADFTIPDTDPERWRLAGRRRLVAATDVALYNAPLTMDILSTVMLGAYNRDNWILGDEQTAIAELAEFKRRGGSSLVDATSIGLGRNPEGLQRVARATGVNIIMSTGWYTAGWWPVGIEQQSIDELTGQLVHDITVGVDGTAVRAGFIGEVGTSGNPDDPIVNRILRASARASRSTGAAVLVDASGADAKHARILDILEAEGADLHRVVLGHSDFLAGQVDYLKSLLDRGATMQFDMLGEPPLVTRTRPIDSEVAKTVFELIKAGYADRVLLSQDIHRKTSLKAYGGTGYSFIEESFLPYLKRLGVTDGQIDTMVVQNPRRLLTLAAPRNTEPDGELPEGN